MSQDRYRVMRSESFDPSERVRDHLDIVREFREDAVASSAPTLVRMLDEHVLRTEAFLASLYAVEDIMQSIDRCYCAEEGTYYDVSDVEFRLTCEHEWGSWNNERNEQCKRCHTWRRKP